MTIKIKHVVLGNKSIQKLNKNMVKGEFQNKSKQYGWIREDYNT